MAAENARIILETIELTKSYGKFRGIEDINLSVNSGEIYGFIGPNGAGKSTTIRTILGLLHPDKGQIRLFGADGLRDNAALRSRIGFVPSDLNYYEGLNVRQLLEYSANFYECDASKRMGELCERFMLEQKRKIKDLSMGNKKKLCLIQALLHKPDLLILDEPTSGLDPLIQSRFYEILREEQLRGCTVFFSSHTLSEVERLCSRVAIIREGRIVNISGLGELRKLYLKRFRLILKKGCNFVESEISGVSELKITPRGAEGLYRGDVKDLMRCIAALPVDDAVIEDPSLEEIFMHYYSEKEGTDETKNIQFKYIQNGD